MPVRQDMRLGRRQRLLHTADFAVAYAQGRRLAGRFFIVWLHAAPDAALRLGVVTSRRVGNAVARNRARRLLRDVWRRNRQRFDGGYDAVFVARRAILTARSGELERDLLETMQRAGHMAEDTGTKP